MEKMCLAPGLREKLRKSWEEAGHIQAGSSTWLCAGSGLWDLGKVPMDLQSWCPGGLNSDSWASGDLNSPQMVAHLMPNSYKPLWEVTGVGRPEGVTQPLRHHPLPTVPVAILSSQGFYLWFPIPPFPNPCPHTHTLALSLNKRLKLAQCGLDHERHGKLRRSFPSFYYILEFVWHTTGSRWAICFLSFFCVLVNPMSPCASPLSTLMMPRLAGTTPLLLHLPSALITDYFTVILCLYYVALTSSQGSNIIPHRLCAPLSGSSPW